MPNFSEPVTSQSNPGPAVKGESDGTAVWGQSHTWVGVFGATGNAGTNGTPAGVYGLADNATGVVGESKSNIGVLGVIENATNSGAPAGVFGLAGKSSGVIGVSKDWMGVYGESASTVGGCGVMGKGTNGNVAVRGESPNGIGILGQGSTAGRFEGNIEVTGNVSCAGDILIANADCAENFTVAGAAEIDPGTVMVLGAEGVLRQSSQAYDRKVAGIISGAGDYRPGIVLDSQGTEPDRLPVALVGKVFCKVDASYGAVEIGDLLTTSPTPGHAMRADDPMKAFGAVIGKALRPLAGGQDLIPVLVSLQ
jgi:hypothetical protein